MEVLHAKVSDSGIYRCVVKGIALCPGCPNENIHKTDIAINVYGKSQIFIIS